MSVSGKFGVAPNEAVGRQISSEILHGSTIQDSRKQAEAHAIDWVRACAYQAPTSDRMKEQELTAESACPSLSGP